MLGGGAGRGLRGVLKGPHRPSLPEQFDIRMPIGSECRIGGFLRVSEGCKQARAGTRNAAYNPDQQDRQ